MQEVGLIAALFSGIVSFFAPCVIPLLPAYISYVTGVSLKELKRDGGIEDHRKEIVLASIWYLLGFSLFFVALGTTAASLGSLFRQKTEEMQLIGGLLVMIFSLHYLEILKLPGFFKGFHFKIPNFLKRVKKTRSFLMGVIFATAWTPCVGAVLGVILTLAAASQTASTGALLLLVYSLGISLPFLTVSLLVIKTPKLLSLMRTHMSVVSKIVGIFLFILGFLLFNNTARWFLEGLTYNNLNAWLFQLAVKFGYQIR
ncbi:cytochrome c biogenesis CcdA family protein [Patescibacteria group bacterium]